MNEITIKYTLGSNAPLTSEQQKELARLEQMDDADINFDDIPELDEQFWQKAVRNHFYNVIQK